MGFAYYHSICKPCELRDRVLAANLVTNPFSEAGDHQAIRTIYELYDSRQDLEDPQTLEKVPREW